jgi:hypothetical protein
VGAADGDNERTGQQGNNGEQCRRGFADMTLHSVLGFLFLNFFQVPLNA